MQTALSQYEQMRAMDTLAVRRQIRNGEYSGHTAGLAKGKLQANLAILPEAYALDFARFCQRNPKPCPIVGISETGAPQMHTLGAIDIRTDVPRYNVYRDGILDQTVSQISEVWRDDLVGFALGCSFTFEHALLSAGIPLRHIEANKTVPMYRTSVATAPAGPFGGGLVVSMRAMKRAEVRVAIDICRRYPHAHGTPIHFGDPAQIGIDDLAKPDWGDESKMERDDVPVFWACGVTPQNAIMRARLPFFISHTPGCMLITDVAEDSEVPVLS